MKRIQLILAAAAFSLFVWSCKSGSGGKENEYNAGTKTLAEIEHDQPARFLRVNLDKRRNLIGQTVVAGEIVNTAKVVAYKNIEVDFKFFNAAGELLERDRQIIDESIAAGASTSYKFKYRPPRGADSVAADVISAVAEK